MRISDWSSDVCSSDLHATAARGVGPGVGEKGMGVAYYAVSGRACRAAATAVARAGNCSGIARAGRRLSVHEANHLVAAGVARAGQIGRAHVELQSLMRISYAVFCLKKKKKTK